MPPRATREADGDVTWRVWWMMMMLIVLIVRVAASMSSCQPRESSADDPLTCRMKHFCEWASVQESSSRECSNTAHCSSDAPQDVPC